ncbi:hypothetical protein [Carnobacterium sp. TMP28]|uniref:hypothetical protein n=1 Tax=Carnobacterium sp. TMP28 TaxID=3397060 RepID=UPI0039DF546D
MALIFSILTLFSVIIFGVWLVGSKESVSKKAAEAFSNDLGRTYSSAETVVRSESLSGKLKKISKKS